MSKVSDQDAELEDFTNSQLTPGIDLALIEEVEVWTDKLQGRQRQISASIKLEYPVEQVWQVLTRYDELADFIPNLAKSHRLPHPSGGIRLEQVGVQQILFLDFSARVVLDMEEDFPRQIRFSMVEGDFNAFSGSWSLKPWTYPGGIGTTLTYTVVVWPKRTMPVIAIERRIRSDLPLNLIAIRQRLTSFFGGKATAFQPVSLVEE